MQAIYEMDIRRFSGILEHLLHQKQIARTAIMSNSQAVFEFHDHIYLVSQIKE